MFIATAWSVSTKKPVYLGSSGWTLLKSNAKKYKTENLAAFAGISHADGAPNVVFPSKTSVKDIYKVYDAKYPKRKKNPVKKKRTAKQIAATKRLVAFNKKRRGGKTTVRKSARIVKKKVRRKNPATVRYVVTTIAQRKLQFFNGIKFSPSIADAANFSLARAKEVSGKYRNLKVAIAPTTATTRSIMDTLTGK